MLFDIYIYLITKQLLNIVTYYSNTFLKKCLSYAKKEDISYIVLSIPITIFLVFVVFYTEICADDGINKSFNPILKDLLGFKAISIVLAANGLEPRSSFVEILSQTLQAAQPFLDMIPEMIQAGSEGLISQFDFGPLPLQGGAFMVQPLLYETKSSLQGLQHIFLGLSDYSSMILKTFIQQSAISNSKQCICIFPVT